MPFQTRKTPPPPKKKKQPATNTDTDKKYTVKKKSVKFTVRNRQLWLPEFYRKNTVTF